MSAAVLAAIESLRSEIVAARAASGGVDPEFTIAQVAQMKNVSVRTVQLWMYGTPQKLGYYNNGGAKKTIGASHLAAMQQRINTPAREQKPS